MNDIARLIQKTLKAHAERHRQRFADGGTPDYDPMTGLQIGGDSAPDAAPDAGTFLSPAIKATGNFLSGANDMAKRFTNYDRQMTEDILNLPRRIYQNPQKANEVGQRFLGGENWVANTVKSGVTLPRDVMTGELPMYVMDPVSGEMIQNPEVIQRAQDTAGLAGGQTLMAGARSAAESAAAGAGRNLRVMGRPVLAADSQAAGAPLAALEHAPRFHSVLEQSVGKLSDETMTGSEWLSRLWEPERTKKVGVRGPDNRVVIDPETGQPMTKETVIQGRSPLPGVTKEELDHSGVLGFLEQNADRPVSKAEIAEHLEANKLELGEVNKGGETIDVRQNPRWQKLMDANDALTREYHRIEATPLNGSREGEYYRRQRLDQITDEMNANHDLMREIENKGGNDPTRYHGYQLPGGENYRERLLTLPTPNDRYIAALDKMRAKYGDMPWGQMPMTDAERALIEKHIGDYGDNGGTYKSSHWPDEVNPVVHRRTNDRAFTEPLTPEQQAVVEARRQAQGQLNGIRQDQHIVARQINEAVKPLEQARKDKIMADYMAKKISGPDAQRALMEVADFPEIKPLQDRLQQLRAQEDAVRKSMPEEPKPKSIKSLHLEEIQSDWHQQGRKNGYGESLKPGWRIVPMETDGHFALYGPGNSHPFAIGTRDEVLGAAQSYGGAQKGVPDAPFKKNWHELALKDAIREAAEKGHDRISWTPGEAQAARYDLSKQIDHLKWYKDGDLYRVVAEKDGELVSRKSAMSEQDLAATVGKEMAEKIISAAEHEQHGVMSGLDLKVGGEGMKGFYDKIIPDYLNKIGKPHGVKVEKGEVSGNVVPTWDNERWTVSGRNGQTFATKAEAEEAAKMPVHYMDLPQSLKDQALKKGFSLFEDSATAGAPLSALERAAQQGYDTKTPLYHGTSKDKDFNKFKDSRHGTWTTQDPKEASGYAMNNDSKSFRLSNKNPKNPWEMEAVNGADRVLPLYAKPLKNPAYVESYPERLQGATNYKKAQSEWFDELRAKGHDGVILPGGIRVDFNNANLRSQFAKFDPKNEGKSGLLLEDSATPGLGLAAIEHTINNPNFKKWFGDSQVVDGNGKPQPLYHGTTSNFDTFNKDKAGIESDWGAGFYFSNKPKDVEHNYAGFGPDLTNKIERRIEQMGDDVDPAEARAAVLADLAPHQGATLPVFVKMERPFKVGGKDETFLDYEGGYNPKTDEYDLPESGKLVDFIDALKTQAAHFDANPDSVISSIMEEAMDGGISASRLQEIFRNDSEINYATDPNTGDMASHEVLRRALQNAGFDGVIDRSVNKKFGSEKRIGKPMEGMDRDTVHYIAFEPNQVKSATGNSGAFDPKKSSMLLEDAGTPGAPLSALENQSSRISTRLPTGKKNPENALADERLKIDVAAMQKDPGLFAHNVGLVSQYPNLLKKETKGTPTKVAQHFIDYVKDNLLHLYDQVPENIRERSKKWYEGGNKIVNDFAGEFGAHPNSSAGAVAALSPQKDWFQNVDLARRVHDIHYNRRDVGYSPEMETTSKRIFGDPKFATGLDRIRGKTYGELTDPADKAMWMRLHDEAHNPRTHRLVTPEGEFGDVVRNANGSPSGTGWGSLTEIGKAIQALEANGDVGKISGLMGERHKVRNFYNNLIDPFSPHGDVTIDTHAVAAGLMRPLSGNSMEVAHNFGNYPGAGLPTARSSAVTGVGGTYGLYADAYREAAKARGVTPREMQSVTWEAVRGLFKDTWKSSKKNTEAVDSIWRKYQKGLISKDEARTQITDLAGGIQPPDWHGPGGAGGRGVAHDEAGRNPADQAELPGPGVPGRGPEAVDRRAGSGASDVPPRAVKPKDDEVMYTDEELPPEPSTVQALPNRGQTDNPGKNLGTFRGKPVWSGAFDPRDGHIIEAHPFEKAEKADFHHARYFSARARDKMVGYDPDAQFFWIGKDGKVQTEWRHGAAKPSIVAKVEQQLGLREKGMPPRALKKDFQDWFSGSKAVDEKGKPLTLYRGEHGELPEGQSFHSRLNSLTFGSKEAANTYAMHPNDYRDTVQAPRVSPVHLQIKKPFVNNHDDPFVDLSHIEKTLGRKEAMRIAKKFANDIEYTGNWEEHYQGKYDNVADLLKRKPSELKNLYFMTHKLLDDPHEVSLLKKHGYDGAIHTGNGETATETEYRVFDPSQVKSAIKGFAQGGAVEGNDMAPRAFGKFAEGGAPGGMFDDLIPKKPQGMFDDLLPQKTETKERGPMSGTDVAAGAIQNFLPSAGQFASDVVRPITHPIETATGLKDLGLGILEKTGAIGTIFPSAGGGHEKYADAAWDYLKDRYGGWENVKKTIAKDPVGALSDAALPLTGVGGLSRLPGTVGKIAEVTGNVGRAIDPLMAPVNAARVGTKAVGELLTHTGSPALEHAYRTGVEGGEGAQIFRDQMRGVGDMSEPVEIARRGLEGYRRKRSSDYKAGMGDITSIDRQIDPLDRVLDFGKIDDAVAEARKVQTFGSRVLDKGADAVRSEMMREIAEWKALPPATYHTIEGLDALKRSLGHMMMDTAPGSSARKASSEIYHAVRNTITDYDPKYAKVMKDYEQASAQVRELERSLSLGEKASADTALRKLQSILRNNVNTNYGRRMELGKLLEENGAKHLMAALSGQAMNAWAPRGLGKLGAELAAVGAAGHFVSPASLAMLPLMSPRLMGEAAHFTGRTAGRVLRGSNRMLGNVGLGNRSLGNASYRLGRSTNPFENVGVNPYGQ